VLDVISELGYMPSMVARSLSLGKTHTVSTVAPFFTRPSVVERLRGIEASLASSDYNLVVFNVENVERRDACLREVPRKERSDGVLLVSLAPTAAESAAIRESGVPLVLVDRYSPDLPSVVIDDVFGGYLATRHLIDLGHRRIGFLSDPLQDPLNFDFISSRHRFQGYRQALAEAGILFRDDYQAAGLHGRYEARLLAHRLLDLSERPTAIFTTSDTQAMGVLEAARDRNLRVPDDLSVVGFDDIDVAEYLGLTTIRQPLFESGARGVELLLELMAAEEPARKPPRLERLGVELIVRTTTRPPLA
jgi:DNA-binding LacI/PurR family transcriptional regulator